MLKFTKETTCFIKHEESEECHMKVIIDYMIL